MKLLNLKSVKKIVVRSKHSDVVEHINMTERFYFDNEQQGKEILKHLKKVYTNMKYYVYHLYESNTKTAGRSMVSYIVLLAMSEQGAVTCSDIFVS